LKISRHQLQIWWSQIEFTGDLLAEPVNGYYRPLNPQLMHWNFQIKYSYLHSNVIMCIYVYWQDDVSCNQLTDEWIVETGLTLEGDSGEEVALWRLTSLSRWSKAKFKSPCNPMPPPAYFLHLSHLWKCRYRACVYWNISVVNRGGMGAKKSRRAPMMHQKYPCLTRTIYTIDQETRTKYHWVIRSLTSSR
jgi:hypothetical protein